MDTDLVRRLSPEEKELEKKKQELAAIEANLAQKELDLATIHAELHAFEQKYRQIVGIRYAELDRIEAQISEYMSYLESSGDFKPSVSLKQLYREVAKKIHPDLATDEAERARRQKLMAEANQAYEDNDEIGLREILHQWEISPDAVRGEGIGMKLVRILRQIAQGRERLEAIEREIKAIENTELYELKIQVTEAEVAGRNLLVEMSLQLDLQITSAQQKLTELKEKTGLNK